MNNENKKCHLNMIQGIISRMGNNGFALKGWTVGIMIAIYTFTGQNSNKAIIITLIPLIVFWMLYTYYLMLEKKFRLLYDNVRTKDEKEIDYSMSFNDINIKDGKGKNFSFIKIMFSKSILPFYLVCIVTTLIIYFVKF